MLEWKQGDDGCIDVLLPRFGRGRLGRYLSARLARPDISIRLDATGSFVWQQCDGQRTVAEIAAALEQRDGPSEDLQPRLVTFLVGMVRRKMIAWE